VKTVCAWGCRVICDGPEKRASHGKCSECERILFSLVETDGQVAPQKPAANLKVVCPWCDTISHDGPKEFSTYRTCPECEKKFMDEFRPYLRECRQIPSRYRGRQYPDEFHDFAQEHLVFIALFLSVIAVVILASVALNHLTGGWVPNLIQWAVDRPPK
jgi:hypothetical protein